MNDKIAIIFAPVDIEQYLHEVPEEVQARLARENFDFKPWDGSALEHFLIHHRVSKDPRGSFFSTYIRLPCGQTVGGNPKMDLEADQVLRDMVLSYTTEDGNFCAHLSCRPPMIIESPYLTLTDPDRVPKVDSAFRSQGIQTKVIFG